MIRTWLFSLALTAVAACGNPDNLVLGGIGATNDTPLIVFDNIGSSISGLATLTDANGNPLGNTCAQSAAPPGCAAVVIVADRSDLCSVLQAHPDYFRKPPEVYEALILLAPPGYLGTFFFGRTGVDENAAAEIIATTGPATTVTPFTGANGSYIALTSWPSNPGDNAIGSFDILFQNPSIAGVFEFTGRYRTTLCATLDGTLLP